MWTFNQLWNVNDPESAKEKLEQTKYLGMVSNLEEQAVSMVGTEIYQKLIKGYTEKQWNKDCKDLPPSIIKRIPVRFTWDSNYFDDKYTGIPIGGYTQIFEKMLEGVEVRLGIDFFDYREILEKQTQKIIYTGPIDRFFDYKFGKLEYRSLKWNTKRLDIDNFQGIPVVNYTDRETPYTRIIEHKWFDPQNQKGTIISYEFPEDYNGDNEPYYPIRDEKNSMIFDRYNNLAKLENKYIFGGRLASYVYYDMHQVIAQALKLTNDLSNS
jgi:UDP-galactopyranose mutase